ncbi:MAG: EMC3/TMCO1 family protein [Nitrososphaerales archaeon]
MFSVFDALLFSGLSSLGSLFQNTTLAVSIPKIDLLNTALVALEAIGVNVLYAVGRRKFTNLEKMRRISSEMKAFRAELSAATKAGDKAKVEKLKKKQQQMQKMQMETTMDNFKPTLLFGLPLIGVYYLVSNFIGVNTILAISPIPIQIFGYGPSIAVNFFWWYFLCSFTFQTIITRLFGLTMD